MSSNLSNHQLKFFADYIQKHLGIQFSEANFFHLEHRLAEISKQCGFQYPDGLWAESQKGINGFFKQLLLDVATNNESSFFRDPNLFLALTNSVIPDIINNFPGITKINIWSAACSTGQEPYSVLMSLEEERKKNILYPEVHIRATDISDRVLKYSEDGVYSQLEVQRGLPTKLMLQYFKNQDSTSWKFSDPSKSKIKFYKQNLLDPFLFSETFHVVLIRNVLIYQSIENRRLIIEKIYQMLPKGGYMIMGAAESLLGINENFISTNYNNILLYKK